MRTSRDLLSVLCCIGAFVGVDPAHATANVRDEHCDFVRGWLLDAIGADGVARWEERPLHPTPIEPYPPEGDVCTEDARRVLRTSAFDQARYVREVRQASETWRGNLATLDLASAVWPAWERCFEHYGPECEGRTRPERLMCPPCRRECWELLHVFAAMDPEGCLPPVWETLRQDLPAGTELTIVGRGTEPLVYRGKTRYGSGHVFYLIRALGIMGSTSMEAFYRLLELVEYDPPVAGLSRHAPSTVYGVRREAATVLVRALANPRLSGSDFRYARQVLENAGDEVPQAGRMIPWVDTWMCGE